MEFISTQLELVFFLMPLVPMPFVRPKWTTSMKPHILHYPYKSPVNCGWIILRMLAKTNFCIHGNFVN